MFIPCVKHPMWQHTACSRLMQEEHCSQVLVFSHQGPCWTAVKKKIKLKFSTLITMPACANRSTWNWKNIFISENHGMVKLSLYASVHREKLAHKHLTMKIGPYDVYNCIFHPWTHWHFLEVIRTFFLSASSLYSR